MQTILHSIAHLALKIVIHTTSGKLQKLVLSLKKILIRSTTGVRETRSNSIQISLKFISFYNRNNSDTYSFPEFGYSFLTLNYSPNQSIDINGKLSWKNRIMTKCNRASRKIGSFFIP